MKKINKLIISMANQSLTLFVFLNHNNNIEIVEVTKLNNNNVYNSI